MRSDWKRSMAVLLGASAIALTAACGAEVAGTAQGGVPAAANAVSSAEQAPGESSQEVPNSGEVAAPSASVPEVATSPSPTDESAEPGGNDTTTVAEPPTSPEPTSQDPETAENGTETVTTTPQRATPTSAEVTPAPTTTSTSDPASAKEYAFLKDYCTLMPKSFTTGLEKDTTRKPDLSCTYKAPESSKVYRAATVTGGFSFGDEVLSQSFNVDAAKVKIDGRDGYTWTNSSKSLYSATFNLPDPDGGDMSILVIISDDKSPAELKKTALALAAAVSKEVPR